MQAMHWNPFTTSVTIYSGTVIIINFIQVSNGTMPIGYILSHGCCLSCIWLLLCTNPRSNLRHMNQLYPIHHANTYYHNYVGLYSQDYDWIASHPITTHSICATCQLHSTLCINHRQGPSASFHSSLDLPNGYSPTRYKVLRTVMRQVM